MEGKIKNQDDAWVPLRINNSTNTKSPSTTKSVVRIDKKSSVTTKNHANITSVPCTKRKNATSLSSLFSDSDGKFTFQYKYYMN